MGKTIRKMLAAALSLVMVATMLPTPALADGASKGEGVGHERTYSGYAGAELQAQTEVAVVGYDATPPIPEGDVLYAPADPHPANDFIAQVTGRFDGAAVLAAEDVDQSSPAYQTLAQAAAGDAIGGMWQLSVSTSTPGVPAASAITSVSLQIDQATYDARPDGASAVRVVALEGGKLVEYAATRTVLPGEDGAPERYYITFARPTGDTAIGAYALMVAPAGAMTVTARVATGAGQVLPLGTTEWAAGGQMAHARYTFLPFAGQRIDTVALDGREVSLTGVDFLDIPIVAGASHVLEVSFCAVSSGGGDVTLKVVARPADASVKGAPDALAAADEAPVPYKGTSTVAQAELPYGSAVRAQMIGSGIVASRIEVAPLGASGALPSESDPSWREVSVLGSAYAIPALTEGTAVRFTFADGVPLEPERFSMQGTILSDEEPPRVLARTDGSGIAKAEGGSIRVHTTTPALGSQATVSVSPATANWQVNSAELALLDETGAQAGSMDVTEAARAGTVSVPAVACSYEVRVIFERVDIYYINTTRGGKTDPVGITQLRATRADGKVSFKVAANAGYVVDIDKTTLAFGSRTFDIRTTDAGAKAEIGIPFAGGVTQTMKVAFRPKSDDDGFVDVNVNVGVSSSGSSRAREGGGIVSPTHITIRKGASYTFSVFPDDGFDVESITWSSTDAGGTTGVVRPEDMRPISDATLGDGAGDAAYGYEFTIERIPSDIVVDVVFKDAPGQVWGDIEEAVISDNGSFGTISPKGTISIPAGHVVSTELFARPAANCHLEHLWVAQGSGKPEDMIDQVSDGRVTLPLTGGMKVHAVFASDAVRVEVDENVAGGRISPDGSMVVSRAEQLALFFDADEGRCLREVVLTYPDGQGGFDEVRYDVPEGTYLYTLEGWELEEGMRISAVFGPGTRPEPSGGMFTIEPRVVGTGGAVSPAHAAVYAADMHPTFLLLPDAGYMVDELRVLAVAADGSEQLVEEMAGAEAASSYTFGTLTSDMRLEVSFTPIAFHTITFSWNVEGGTMDADGAIEGALSVLDGQEVAISVVPAEGYEVASVRYEPASEAPGLLDLLAGRAGGRDLEVPEEGGVVRFTATEDAHVTGTFVERATEPGPGPDDGNGDGDEHAGFFIEASAGAHGTISPSGRVGVRAGADIAFDLRPDAGYQVAFVEADGKRYAGHRSQWVLKGVSADHKLHVEFEPVLPAGDNSEPARTIRRLQSLAQTSDALPIAALVLAAISCASAGAALIVRNRRRNERRADDER